MVTIEELKREARKALEKEDIKYLIGYRESDNSLMPVPCFISDPQDVDQLTWGPTCVYNLTRYLIEEERQKARAKEPDKRRVAIIVKGCDSRGLNVLMQEKIINRDNVYIIGVSCEHSGVVDGKNIEKKYKEKEPESINFKDKDSFIINTRQGNITVPALETIDQRCLECTLPYPDNGDVLIGEKIARKCEDVFQSLKKVEALSLEERWAFWQEKIEKCIRCYACRSICTMCYCDECVVDSTKYAVTAETSAEEKAQKIKWIEKSPQLSENMVFHLIRALHLAGRCINCRECERACPQDIPLHYLNRKLAKDVKLLFDYESGLDSNEPPLLATFKENDPEDFIL